MLRLIYGTFGSGKSSEVLSLISQRIKEKDKYEKSIYLIVPEQDTVRAELAAANVLGSGSALCFEVQNFSRLCDSVFRQIGGLSYRYADTTAKALCMWQSIKSLGGLLTSSVDESDDGRIGEILSLISELRSNGIDIKKLEVASKKLDDTASIKSELSDLCAIISLYESILAQNYRDSEKDIELLCSRLEGKKFFAGYDVYIDGFTSFTADQLRLIGRLIDECDSVTVTVPYDRARGEYLYSIEAQNTARALRFVAQSNGSDVEEYNTDGSVRSDREDIKYLCDNFYRDGADTYQNSAENISIFSCDDPRQETEAVAAIIQRKVQEGARYKDIAVVARNAPDYAGVLDSTFSRHGIPCFFSSEVRAESHPLIKLIYSAIAVYVNNWRREDVIAFLKTGLCGVSADDCDIFEKYVNTWKINGARFVQTADFVQSPGGYTDRSSPAFDLVLDKVNDVKHKITDALLPFFSAIGKKEATVRDMCSALWEFLAREQVKEALEAEARQLVASGDEQTARENEGIYKCLVSVIDTMVYTVGEENIDARGFLRLLRMCLKTKSVSVIPTSADAVTVGSAHMLRVADIKHVILIGVAEGVFPRAVRDNGYFDYVKRKQLSSVGIEIQYDAQCDVSKELFYFARAVCSASESVTLLYSRTGIGGASYKCSSCAGALMRLMSIKSEKEYLSLPLSDRIFDRASLDEAVLCEMLCDDSADAELCAVAKLCENNEKYTYTLSPRLSEDVARALFSDKLNMTQARLESYAMCHFAYYCKYILALEREREYDFRSSDIGNFVHDILDKLTDELTKDGVFRADIPESELNERIDNLIESYIGRVCPENSMKSARLLSVFRRIRRSVQMIAQNICDEFAQSRFSIVAHEMGISATSPNSPSPLEFTLDDGAKLSIYGTLDRADALTVGEDVYVRVVDYKTGPRVFSLEDIRVGLGLQLLIYLFTVCAQTKTEFKKMLGASENGRILPAGMLYYAAKVGDRKLNAPEDSEKTRAAVQRSFARNGILLDDRNILRAMEDGLEGKYIPIKTYKDGSIGSGASTKLFSEEQFSQLYLQTSEVISGVASQLHRGMIDPSPIEHPGVDACQWCDMKLICRKSGTVAKESSDDESEE